MDPEVETKQSKTKECKLTKEERCLNFQSELDKNGYTKQNLFLVERGFKKLKQNLKTLLKVKGDQDLALTRLTLKLARKQEALDRLRKEGKLKFDLEDEKCVYLDQVRELEALGFLKVKKLIKLLSKNEGNVQAVADLLKKRGKLGAKTLP